VSLIPAGEGVKLTITMEFQSEPRHNLGRFRLSVTDDLQPASPGSPGYRLAVLAGQRSDYKMLVGVPPSKPVSWAVVSRVTDDSATVEGHGDIPLRQINAFVVSYPSGEIVDRELAGLLPPTGMTGLVRGQRQHDDVLHSADLEVGSKYIKVEYGPSAKNPNKRGHYSTTLTNISGQRIKVLRFAGYSRTPDGWKLGTVTGTFFSADQFREWYGLGEKEWLGPGESACDPNNYGGPPAFWAYYCQAEDGEEFIAGNGLE
jgi:hypothetical protein